MSQLTCKATGKREGYRGLFPPLCGAPASFMTPFGPQCEEHAQEGMRNIREGTCLAAMIADQKGVSRDVLLRQFVRIT